MTKGDAEFPVRSRRMRVLCISAAALLDTLSFLSRRRGVWCSPELPDDAKVVGVTCMGWFHHDLVQVFVESREFDLISPGSPIPELKLTFHRMPKDAEDL